MSGCWKKASVSLLLALTLVVGSPPCAFAQSSDSREDILNYAALNPTAPRSEALDAYLEELLFSLLDEDMDTYEQVKACYDYLVANVRYGSHMGQLGTPVANGVTCRDIYNTYGEVEGFGAVALTAHKGMCNAYASAFILMAREIGLNAYLVKGYTRSAGGGYAYHEWAEMEIDGQVYVFDPQLEQDLRRAGLPRYSVFFKTYDEVGGRYSK